MSIVSRFFANSPAKRVNDNPRQAKGVPLVSRRFRPLARQYTFTNGRARRGDYFRFAIFADDVAKRVSGKPGHGEGTTHGTVSCQLVVSRWRKQEVGRYLLLDNWSASVHWGLEAATRQSITLSER